MKRVDLTLTVQGGKKVQRNSLPERQARYSSQQMEPISRQHSGVNFCI